jgi:hypothetical protein
VRRIWTTPSVVQADLIKCMLEGHGIHTQILNELTAQYTGIGYPLPTGQALAFAWPEIWVEDADYDRALALVTELVGNGSKRPDEE